MAEYAFCSFQDETMPALGAAILPVPVRSDMEQEVFGGEEVRVDLLPDGLYRFLGEYPELGDLYAGTLEALTWLTSVSMGVEGDSEAPARLLEMGLGYATDSLLLRSNYALVLQLQGKGEDAPEQYEVVLAEPEGRDNPMAQLIAARLHAEQGEYLEAYRLLDEMAQGLPANDAFWDFLAEMRELAGVEDETAAEASAGYETLELPRRALKALSGLEGLAAGPLSPLGRLEAPAGAADTGALISDWEKLEGAWKWAIPALLDPHRTIALVMGDGNTNLVGQYLFPDADALGPGFHVGVGGDALTLAGPLSPWFIGDGLYSHLALEDVAEVEPFHMEMSADHFWALMACLDAYRAAALERRLRRIGGGPAGVGVEDAARMWTDGISLPNPGWVVSLFSLLAPDEVPRDLPQRLPRLFAEMARQGQLVSAADAGGALYALPEALSPLLWGPTTAFYFGLVTQRLAAGGSVEVTIVGGWRTPGGVWLADLSTLASGKAALALVGPALAEAIIDNVIDEDALAPSWEEFVMDTPYARNALIPRLRELRVKGEAVAAAAGAAPGQGVSAPPGFCARCGKPLRAGARFCGVCGATMEGSEAGADVAGVGLRRCPSCGNELQEDFEFCNACGRPLQREELQPDFCPWCGSQLRKGARFCQECGKQIL